MTRQPAAPFGANSVWRDLRIWVRAQWPGYVAYFACFFVAFLAVRYVTGGWPF